MTDDTPGSPVTPKDPCKDYWLLTVRIVGLRGNAGVRQSRVLAPSLFNACMGWVLGRVVTRVVAAQPPVAPGPLTSVLPRMQQAWLSR